MLRKASQAAEQLAGSVSRRRFLDKLGRAALTTAGAIAGLFSFSSPAQGAPGLRCCAYYYYDPHGGSYWSYYCSNGPCAKSPAYQGFFKVNHCDECHYYNAL